MKDMHAFLKTALAAALVLGLMVSTGCGRDEIPADLLGYWVTSAPRYSDCGLEITRENITFSKGLDYLSVNRIDDVEVEPKEGKTLVKITYEEREGGEFTLSLYHYAGPDGGSVRFVNQRKMVWRREEAGAVQ